jgi:hypothetical protein
MESLVLYDENFADLQKIEKPEPVEQPEPEPVEQPEPDEPRQRQASPDMETSLLDELNNECKMAKQDYDSYRHPTYSGRSKIDQRIKKDILDFVNRRCENYSTNIETIITNLIEHHNFPEYLFDGYKKYASMVRMSVGEPRAVEALYQLYILAHGVIPRDVMYQQPRIISPVLDSSRDMGM